MSRYFTERTVRGRAGPVLVLTLEPEQLAGMGASEQCQVELSRLEVASSIVVDFRSALSVQSGILAAVIALHRAALRGGWRLCLCGIGPQMAEVLARLKLDQVVLIEPSEEAAVRTASEPVG